MSLVISDITKSFGGFRAINGVSLEVPAGGLVGLIGPNGAGKSTLFSIISGFLLPDTGSIRLNGHDMNALRPAERARAGMMRTFQVPREFAHLTVRENLMAAAPNQTGESLIGLFLRPGRVRQEENAIANAADDIIRFLKLDKVGNLPAGKLSGGQKKLVELGRALMVKPQLIMLDEPFAGVNPVLIGEIMERITELNSRGIGFLVIEHDLEALTRLTPKLYVMDHGSLLTSGAPDDVMRDARVREAYLGGTAA